MDAPGPAAYAGRGWSDGDGLATDTGKGMDQNSLLLLIGAAVVGLAAVILMLRRQRRERDDATRESPFGVSTEGEKVCPKCGGQNLWTASTCVFCGGPLRG